MATTDRMGDLNSQRFITDRTGKLVTLGNAVEDSALSGTAIVIAGAAGGAIASNAIPMNAISVLTYWNGSTGLWVADIDSDAIVQLIMGSASFAAGPINSAGIAALTFVSPEMLIGVQVITSTQVYTPTSGTASIVVEALGGGGGGGGASTTGAAQVSNGGGGGAGAYAKARITSGFSGMTVTIGAAGTGGSAGNNAGTAGGNTTFGAVLTAGGGAGGSGSTAGGVPTGAAAGGAGGTASGSANLFASVGQNAYNSISYNAGLAISGGGGTTLYGAGGECQTTTTAAAGRNASGFGSGGSGAAVAQSQSQQAGGNGAPGLVIIWEYSGV